MARHVWEPGEITRLRDLYPDFLSKTVAEVLGLSVPQIQRKAKNLGLKKSAAFWAAEKKRISRRDPRKATRFIAGMTPWNKGVKGIQYGGRQAETRFKPGTRPPNWAPIGAERISMDGYCQRKVTDTGYPPRDWIGVHILLWQEKNGPIPKGHAVVFRDGNKQRIEIENLELISRGELMKRNSVHNLPKEIVQLVQLSGALKRQINRKKEANHEE
ncbi:MAG: HNH endonuclease signature motif containing protein [Rhodocyclaceae bacterium]|nr:HNH endonuclease signature motif containing protein [Rhodocyclaceae bacterium]